MNSSVDTAPEQTINFDNTAVAFGHESDKKLKKAHWLFSMMNSRLLVNVSTRLASLSLKLHLPVKGLIKKTIFEQFCGGETLEETAATARLLAESNISVILDYGVEAKDSEAEYDHAKHEFLKVIDYAATQHNIPFISIKVTAFASFDLLEKITARQRLNKEEKDAFEKVRQRVNAICQKGAESGIGILIDAEESWIQQPVDDLAMEMMAKYNHEKAVVFNTVQLYRKDGLQLLSGFYKKAQDNKFLLGVKLVRGAYMEKERSRAEDRNFSSPIQPDKAATDEDYNEAIHFCMDHLDNIAFFIASHNEFSNELGALLLAKKGLPMDHPHVHFAQLYGMGDHISFNLAKAGCRVSKYLPYGPVSDVMPYLIRRAQENTSISGQMSRELKLIEKEISRRKHIK